MVKSSGPGVSDLVGAVANTFLPGSGGVAKIGASLLGNGLSWAKSKIAKIAGSGDYTVGDPVKENVLMNSNQIPRFDATKRGVQVTHREFIGDVYSPAGAGSFGAKAYALNPLNQEVFPWLCEIASNYSMWRLDGAAVEFRSMSGPISGSTNTALGTVVLAHQPDPKDQMPSMKHQLEQREGVVSVKPSESVLLGIECAKGSRPNDMLYLSGNIYNSNIPGATSGTYSQDSSHDIDFTTWGKLLVAVDGVQGSSVKLGELWITYSVYLDGARDSLNRCEGNFLLQGVATAGTAISVDPASVSALYKSNLKWIRTGAGYTFPELKRYAGRYFLLSWIRRGEDTLCNASAGFTLGSGLEFVSNYDVTYPESNTTTSTFQLQVTVRVKAEGLYTFTPALPCIGPSGAAPRTMISFVELNSTIMV